MDAVILARHGESVFSERLVMNGDVAVPGPLTAKGREEACELGRLIEHDPIHLCVTSEFERARETADLALDGRAPRRLVLPELNDPLYGSYEGETLEKYRAWADTARSHDDVPGGGESRRAIVTRYASGFRKVLKRKEICALVVAHSLPIAYVLTALDGDVPARRVPLVRHAHPYPLFAADLERAISLLEEWCSSPNW